MIGLALEIGTATSKIGFIGESSPRITTESFHMGSEGRAGQEEQDMFYRQREERIFGSSVNVWRNDISAWKVFDENWQDEEHQLRMHGCSIRKENYFKLAYELIREMKDLKEKHHSMNEESTEFALLITEPNYLKRHEVAKFREAVSAFAFDQLRLSGLYFIKSSVATAYSEGKSNAIVIDSGHNFTSITRVIDGYSDKSVIFNFAGNILSFELENLLHKRGLLDHTNFCLEKRGRCDTFDSLCKYKELTSLKAAFAIDPSSQVETANVSLELPDKTTINIGRQEIVQPFSNYQEYKEVTELYFPQNYYGIARAAVELLDEQNYKNYIDTIIITGGNMLFGDLANRIGEQLTRLLANRHIGEKKIVKSIKPLISNWIGSSIVGSTETFHNFWCTSAEYREHGVGIVNKKCPL